MRNKPFACKRLIVLFIIIFTSDLVENVLCDQGQEAQDLIYDLGLNQMEQDDPRLVEYIKKHVLIAPPGAGVDLNLPKKGFYPESVWNLGQFGQPLIVEELYRDHKRDEQLFYVEAGAFNGFDQSNTLALEVKHNWTGLLVEPNPEICSQLLKLNRKAWILPTCLSTQTRPEIVTFDLSGIIGGIRNDQSHPEQKQRALGDRFIFPTGQKYPRKNVQMQCFPLYSVLKALNRDKIDYFSLDIEGAELLVLKTIPYEKLSISVMGIEMAHVGTVFNGSRKEVRSLFKDKGLRFYTRLALDEFFVQKYMFMDN